MSEVKAFKLDDSSSIINDAIKIVKVNMEIVSLMRTIFLPHFSQQDQNDICKSYWNGMDNVQVSGNSLDPGTKNSGCIYEYIIEGRLREIEMPNVR